MELLTFVILYFSATACLVFVLLFGEAPLFARTPPVAQLHWLLTQGWVEGIEWAVGRCGAAVERAFQRRSACSLARACVWEEGAPAQARFGAPAARHRADRPTRSLVCRLLGQRGVRLLDAAATCCCERSNPVLQVWPGPPAQAGRRRSARSGLLCAMWAARSCKQASIPHTRAHALTHARVHTHTRTHARTHARTHTTCAAAQAVYLATVGLCYWLYTRHVFSLMPSQDAPLYHM
jgi:hypothetical protein